MVHGINLWAYMKQKLLLAMNKVDLVDLSKIQLQLTKLTQKERQSMLFRRYKYYRIEMDGTVDIDKEYRETNSRRAYIIWAKIMGLDETCQIIIAN